MATSTASGGGPSGIDLAAPGGWAQAILANLGAPYDTSTPAGRRNVDFLNAWAKAEGTSARFNPLATTLPAAGASDFNSVGVKNYATPEAGISATVATLQQGYPSIVAALQKADITGVIQDSRGVAELNKWVSGVPSTVESSYVQNIRRLFYGQKGASDWLSWAPNLPAGAKRFYDATVGGVVKAGQQAADGLTGAATAFVRVVRALFDPHTWYRAGLILGGGILIVASVVFLARSSALPAV